MPSKMYLHEHSDFIDLIRIVVEKIIEDNLPSVDEALNDLKAAWQGSLLAEEKFKAILDGFIK